MKHLSKLIKDAKTLLNYIEEEVAIIPLMNRLANSEIEIDTSNRLYHPYETMLREMLNSYSTRKNCILHLYIHNENNCYGNKCDIIVSYNYINENKAFNFLREVSHSSKHRNNSAIEYCCKKLLQAISHEGLDYYIEKKLKDLNAK